LHGFACAACPGMPHWRPVPLVAVGCEGLLILTQPACRAHDTPGLMLAEAASAVLLVHEPTLTRLEAPPIFTEV